jgi:hypothetical protein
MIDKPEIDEKHEPPPLFKSWNTWYGLVLGNLVFLVILFYFFSRMYQ